MSWRPRQLGTTSTLRRLSCRTGRAVRVLYGGSVAVSCSVPRCTPSAGQRASPPNANQLDVPTNPGSTAEFCCGVRAIHLPRCVIFDAIDSVREIGALHHDTRLPQSAHGHTLTPRSRHTTTHSCGHPNPAHMIMIYSWNTNRRRRIKVPPPSAPRLTNPADHGSLRLRTWSSER